MVASTALGVGADVCDPIDPTDEDVWAALLASAGGEEVVTIWPETVEDELVELD